MDFKEHKTAPAPVPPSTFDLTGLSLEEALFLRDILGTFVWGGGGQVQQAMYDRIAFTLDYDKYSDIRLFRANDGRVVGSMSHVDKGNR